MTNHALRPLATRLPYFGVILHQGRVSGSLYRTPVNAFPHGDGFLVALTYGRDVDWLKNVHVAGGCRLIHRGRTLDLVGPVILPLQDSQAIPSWIRGILRLIDVSEAVHLQPGNIGRAEATCR
ncbi:MAG: nitroreductase family deazaflavin-dependent oxidoreductase [Actinomycetota bacterium]|nr:nitroreductase family deazaflavin-dependent oxidoreductase [Actinomycetota bacterium]